MNPVSSFQRASDDKRMAFLTELLRGASASLAAARATLNRGSVYRWKLEDPEFAADWAEIVANRPRPRHLRRRVLGQANTGRAGLFDSSHPATPVATAETSLDPRGIKTLAPPSRSGDDAGPLSP